MRAASQAARALGRKRPAAVCAALASPPADGLHRGGGREQSGADGTSVVSMALCAIEVTFVGGNDYEPPDRGGSRSAEEPAATYSPGPAKAKYHRRCGA